MWNALCRVVVVVCLTSFLASADAQDKSAAKPRARDLGVSFDGTPGPLNAITDVSGITVGHSTLNFGEGKLQIGKGPVRTGVTAILPRGKDSMSNPVFAGWWSLNGNGEMTGTTWVEESGFLEGPVMITNSVARSPRSARSHRLLVVASGSRRNLGRLAQRHQRLPRKVRARLPRHRLREIRPG